MAYARKPNKRGRQGEGGGRKKIHTPAFIEKEADAFLNWAIDKYHRFHDSYALKELILKKEFAVTRGYPSENISKFANQNEKFKHALKRVDDMVEVVTAKLMASADKPTGLIFLSKNICGFRDSHEVNANVAFEPITFVIEGQSDGKN